MKKHKYKVRYRRPNGKPIEKNIKAKNIKEIESKLWKFDIISISRYRGT